MYLAIYLGLTPISLSWIIPEEWTVCGQPRLKKLLNQAARMRRGDPIALPVAVWPVTAWESQRPPAVAPELPTRCQTWMKNESQDVPSISRCSGLPVFFPETSKLIYKSLSLRIYLSSINPLTLPPLLPADENQTCPWLEKTENWQ